LYSLKCPSRCVLIYYIGNPRKSLFYSITHIYSLSYTHAYIHALTHTGDLKAANILVDDNLRSATASG
jgi:hypothetical protein